MTKWRVYGQSKTANILFANELWRRYGSRGLTANAVHPGSIRTNLQRHVSAADYAALQPFMKNVNLSDPGRYKTVEAGAATSVLVATAPEYEDKGGNYFEDCQPATADVLEMVHGQAAHSKSVDSGKRLWSLSLELLKPYYATVEGSEALLKSLTAAE